MQICSWIKSNIILGLCLGLIGCGQPIKSDDTREDYSPPVDMKKAAILHSQLALEYIRVGNMQRAKDKINHALKIAPDQASVHTAAGMYNEHVGEIQSAEREFLKAISLGSKGNDYHQYADFLARQGRYKDALKAYQTVFKDSEYDNAAAAYAAAGLCAVHVGDLDAAEQYFEKALNHDRYKSSALFEMARLKHHKKNPDVAMQYFERYLAGVTPSKTDLDFGISLAQELNDTDKIARYQALVSTIKGI